MPNKKGFTLIELLIVVLLIGMLTGVLISVIDTEHIIKRAKDAVVEATIIKLALAVEAHRSAIGEFPSNTGCTCENLNACELLESLNREFVTCHKTQVVYGGTKLWMEIKTLKMGETLLGGNIDLDDSDAIRYHDWQDGCLAGVSEAAPPLVFVWTSSRSFMHCDPSTDVHPGLVTCNNMHSDEWVADHCKAQ